jgi:flagellar biosynthetic protein FlhB
MAGGSKTEKPTPQRLREARQKGDVATSPEITGAVMALASLVVLQQKGPQVVQGLMSMLTKDLAIIGKPSLLSERTVGAHIQSDVISALTLLAPLAMASVVGVLAIGALNTRGLMSLQALKPSFRKLNPVSGVKHLFGKESLVLLVKVLLKIAVVLGIVFSWQSKWKEMLPQLAAAPSTSGSSLVWAGVYQISVQLTAAFFAIGALDFGYRQWAWYRRLRMSREELKEEMRRSEGNPQIRARIRQIGRKRLRQLLAGMNTRAVPQADVVITNPTHFAVAIQYKPGLMRAPKVVAKGQRLVAQRIKDVARKHNVPLVENKPLAQALYKSVEVNQEVPADLYRAVAQVLAFVYRMRAPRRAPSRPASRTAPAGLPRL